MFFKHDLISLPDLETINVDGKRHYITPAGILPSVTTVLGRYGDKTWIEAWRNKVGAEEADRILRQAGIRGTAIHKLAEKYTMNDPDYKKGAMPVNLATFNTLKPLLQHLNLVHGNELALWSKELNTAGRTDLIGEWDGVKSVLDFKTSKRSKTESEITNYFLQATCYAYMAESLLNMKIPRIVVLIAVDNEEPMVFVKNKSQYLDEMLTVFR